MAKESFDRHASVAVDVTEAWRRITDVPDVVGWVSIVRDAEVLAELEQYRAVIEDKIGMFALRADLDIVVTECEPPRRIALSARGEDRQVGSRIVVDATVVLDEHDESGTGIAIAGHYEVSGRVATFGAGMIRKKATKLLDEFFASMQRELS